MKLAEALLIRADQKKKILSLRERIAQNALAQEGDAPREDIAKLIAECFAVIAEQQALVLKIVAANAAAKLPDGRPLTEVLAARSPCTAASMASGHDAGCRTPSRRTSGRVIRSSPRPDMKPKRPLSQLHSSFTSGSSPARRHLIW